MISWGCVISGQSKFMYYTFYSSWKWKKKMKTKGVKCNLDATLMDYKGLSFFLSSFIFYVNVSRPPDGLIDTPSYRPRLVDFDVVVSCIVQPRKKQKEKPKHSWDEMPSGASENEITAGHAFLSFPPFSLHRNRFPLVFFLTDPHLNSGFKKMRITSSHIGFFFFFWKVVYEVVALSRWALSSHVFLRMF